MVAEMNLVIPGWDKLAKPTGGVMRITAEWDNTSLPLYQVPLQQRNVPL